MKHLKYKQLYHTMLDNILTVMKIYFHDYDNMLLLTTIDYHYPIHNDG